jgi:hypothetical protein
LNIYNALGYAAEVRRRRRLEDPVGHRGPFPALNIFFFAEWGGVVGLFCHRSKIFAAYRFRLSGRSSRAWSYPCFRCEHLKPDAITLCPITNAGLISSMQCCIVFFWRRMQSSEVGWTAREAYATIFYAYGAIGGINALLYLTLSAAVEVPPLKPAALKGEINSDGAPAAATAPTMRDVAKSHGGGCTGVCILCTPIERPVLS